MQNSAFSQFQPIAFVGVTKQAISLLTPLQQVSEGTLFCPGQLQSQLPNNVDRVITYEQSLGKQIESSWRDYRAFVFCLATGAVTRIIAPLLQNKADDPAIIVIDSQGKYVISLCGGHQQGADLLTKLIAEQLGAVPVLTGAASTLDLPAIDTIGKPFGWRKGLGNWTQTMSAIANSQPVEIVQDAGSSLWIHGLPENHNLTITNLKDDRVKNNHDPQQEETSTTSPRDNKPPSPQARIWISATSRKFAPNTLPKVQWHPQVLWVGIGCERDTSPELIRDSFHKVLQANHLAQEAIASICSIDLKADEIGILQLCREQNLPLTTFSAKKLKKIEVPNPSEVVKQEVNTPSVAEASAIKGASSVKDPEGKKEYQLLVTKQIFKKEKQGAVTIAIAQAPTEYLGKSGKLYLIGTGPGSLEQITPAAKTAITAADVVIGYRLYVELIKPLLRPDQIVEALPITQERQRGERAIALAKWGLTVAVISSGDCGIYGMAGLVMEQLQVSKWDGKTPSVQVFPGISAFQSAASRVGAPLMHDFCAISLSDLLTPWEVIRKRIKAAAKGDFVTSFYNPKSLKRTEQIVEAQRIFLKHRSEDTPVAIVRSVYREDEEITITTLGKMLETKIDMLTTVIIGNSNTCEHCDWMITPRGYLE